MSKRIAFCFDGTWQLPMNNTNVYRLYKALTLTSDQVTFYDDGVGADATGLDRLIQGAFGEGLNQKIIDGYTKIAHVYEPGDQVFLFGFSRGAFTARSLAGFIANCGLPTGSFTDDCVTQAFAAYRDPANRAAMLAKLGTCNLGNATIQMVGVWDTVGSMGIPAIFGGIDTKQYGFLDTTLHPDVKNAVHCMAIDEHRAQFPATLWTPPFDKNQTVSQVWFSGCHGDVGGGVLAGSPLDHGTRLCDVTYAYMLQKAQAAGLVFDPAAIAPFATLPAEDALDIIRDSWTPANLKPYLRPILSGSSIANSVGLRIQYALTYTPANLTLDDGPPSALADGYTILDLVDATLPE
jgi:uncharacterized protein (DUF2235 family)